MLNGSGPADPRYLPDNTRSLEAPVLGSKRKGPAELGRNGLDALGIPGPFLRVPSDTGSGNLKYQRAR